MNDFEKLEMIKSKSVVEGNTVKVDIDDFKWLMEQMEHYQITTESPVKYEEMVKYYEEAQEKMLKKNTILTEQLDISQELHRKEFKKVKEYERVLKRIKFAPQEYAHKIVEEEMETIQKKNNN